MLTILPSPDENECLRDPPPCSHSCVNLVGSFACKCPEFMELEHDNRTCCEFDNDNCFSLFVNGLEIFEIFIFYLQLSFNILSFT